MPGHRGFKNERGADQKSFFHHQPQEEVGYVAPGTRTRFPELTSGTISSCVRREVYPVLLWSIHEDSGRWGFGEFSSRVLQRGRPLNGVGGA
jgi:hypothetical protein